MSTQPLTTNQDSDMPVNPADLSIVHSNLSPADAGFVRWLTGADGRSFAINIAKVSRSNLRLEIMRLWPQDIGITKEVDHFISLIAAMVRDMPMTSPDPNVIFSLSVVNRNSADAQRGSLDIPQPQESALLASIDADSGVLSTFILPPTPDMPQLAELAIDDGVLVMCQPLLPMINTSTDLRANGTGPGANVYRTGDRNRDPLSAANDEREHYMGGTAFESIMKGASPNVIIGNIILIRGLNPEFQKGMGGPNPHLGQEEPPEESNDNETRAGLVAEAAVAVEAVEQAEQTAGPGGERREHAGHDHFIGGRRAPDIAHQQHVAAERSEALAAGLERRMEGERAANEYAALIAEEGTKQGLENAKLGAELASQQREAGDRIAERKTEQAVEAAAVQNEQATDAVKTAAELSASAVENRLAAAEVESGRSETIESPGIETTVLEGAGAEGSRVEAGEAGLGFTAAASEVDAAEPERQQSAEAENSQGETGPAETAAIAEAAEPGSDDNESGSSEETLHAIGEALEDTEETAAAVEADEVETAEVESAEIGEGEAVAAGEEHAELKAEAEPSAEPRAEREVDHATRFESGHANDDLAPHGLTHDAAEHAALHRVVEDIAESGAAAYALHGGPLHINASGATAATTIERTARPLPQAGAAYYNAAGAKRAAAMAANPIIVGTGMTAPQAANASFGFAYMNGSKPIMGVTTAKPGRMPLTPFSAAVLSKSNPFASARAGVLSQRKTAAPRKQAVPGRQRKAPASKAAPKPKVSSMSARIKIETGPTNVSAQAATIKQTMQVNSPPLPDGPHQSVSGDFPTLDLG